MPLAAFVRLLRGETEQDPRPNKALVVPTAVPAWSSYANRRRWERVVAHGAVPRWSAEIPRQTSPPKNHGSALRALNHIVKNLRKGQDANRVLVLDIDLVAELDGIFCSPFGAVPKGDQDLSVDARIIHDLSYPEGESVNDFSSADPGISIAYDGAAALAERILDVERRFPGKARMLSGDVSGAFRHVPLHADHVCKFAGTIPELGVLVIDLACPFGWTESPALYALAGNAIDHIHSHAAPSWSHQPAVAAESFDGKVWCDDHNCIEPDVGTRLVEAELSLRQSMIQVLGPSACNDDKFTAWFREGKSLGLQWDLRRCRVSMPPEKIAKARTRINAMLARSSTTRTQLNQLLGSLRHVCTCVRAAVAFTQRISSLSRSRRRSAQVPLDDPAREDLHWFLLVLGTARLHGIPLTRFLGTSAPSIEVLMDASDHGLCAVYPARREFLQLRFDDEEVMEIARFRQGAPSDYGINMRELMSAVFAAFAWSAVWTPDADDEPDVHVLLRIDNTAAVSWNNRRTSRNAHAQLLLRLLALWEVRFRFFCSAGHIAGAENIMADAGSRVWQSPAHEAIFANLCSGWQQVPIPANLRKPSDVWASCSKLEH